MSYTSMKKASRWRRRPAHVERVTTGLGYLYKALRFFGMQRTTYWLMRKPWHVADLYQDGAFWKPVHVYPRRRMAKERLERIAALAEHHGHTKTPQA